MDTEKLTFIEKQVVEFNGMQPVYVVFARVLEEVLKDAVKELGIMAVVQSRPKDVASFIEKSFRKQRELDKRGKGERRAFAHSFTDLCGARVIVEYKDQIEPVCEFIRKNFDIDEGNSVNPEVLGTSTFAYRPIHLIVSMRQGAFSDVVKRLRDAEKDAELKAAFDRLSKLREKTGEMDGAPLLAGPVFKAEIQVRTLVEHAWSNLNHDRIYKGDVQLPPVIQRDMNRISAVLEEADEDFARVVHSVDSYRTYRGRHLSPNARAEEIQLLQKTLDHAPERIGHATRLAKLHNEVGAHDEAEKVLEPIVKKWIASAPGKKFEQTYEEKSQKQDAAMRKRAERDLDKLQDPGMSAVLLEYGWAKWQCAAETPEASPERTVARRFLEYSALMDKRNAEARIRMGKTFEEEDRDTQLWWYGQALACAADDPTVLGEFLRASIRSSQNLTGIPGLRGSLIAGIGRCRHWADVGVCLPLAYYRMGLFQLLIEQGQVFSPSRETVWAHPDVMQSLVASLISYARAAELSATEADILEERQRLREIRNAVGRIFPGADWVDGLLLLECAAKAWAGARRAGEKARGESERAMKEDSAEAMKQAADSAERAVEAARKTAVACLASVRSPDCTQYDGPIAIFVGGCRKDSWVAVQGYKPHIEAALETFGGTVFCGGTHAGISALVGEATSCRCDFRKVAYVRNGPAVREQLMEKTADADGYNLIRLEGDGFTPLEIIQMWTDILASGVDPAQVNVVGINGGLLSAFELRLALTMGARVGVIRQSGGAARELLEDPLWKDHPRLLALPDDVQTVKALAMGRVVSQSLAEPDRARFAEYFHDQRAEDRRKENMAPRDRPWKELDAFFRRDVQERIDYWDVLLEAVNMRIVKESEAGDAKRADSFSDAEIEKMAEMEHARWNVGRLSAGQRHGKEKKDKETHPDIVPWADLPQSEKEKDRAYVKQILSVSGFGYVVVRTQKR